MSDLKKALQQLRGARDTLVAEIAALDAQIAERHATRSKLTSGPVSKADFLGYVKADMDRRAAFFATGLMRAFSEAPKDYGNLNRMHGAGAKLNVNYLTGAQSPLEMTEGAVYFYFGAEMVARLETALDILDWPESAIPSAQRAALIATIDAEIEALNKQRDELSASLVDAGLAG